MYNDCRARFETVYACLIINCDLSFASTLALCPGPNRSPNHSSLNIYCTHDCRARFDYGLIVCMHALRAIVKTTCINMVRVSTQA